MQPLENKFRLSRLHILLVDFRQALRFAVRILKKNLHGVKGEHTQSKLVHLALNTALIVSYSRPFTITKEATQLRPEILIKEELVNTVLDQEAESNLHKRIITKRNQAIAHSDAVAHEIAGFQYDGSTIQFYKYPFEPLSQDEVRLLKRMIRKWIDYFESQQSKIIRKHKLGLKARTE